MALIQEYIYSEQSTRITFSSFNVLITGSQILHLVYTEIEDFK